MLNFMIAILLEI